MSATVPGGDSQTIGSGETGFTEPLNVAGEYNVQGEFNFREPVVGTFTAIRPLDVGSGETLSIDTAIAGSPLNLAGQLDLPGELKLTDSPSFTATGIVQPPVPGLLDVEATFSGGQVITTEGDFAASITFTAPPGGGADGTIDYAITTTGIRAGADVTTAISASFDGIRAGADGTVAYGSTFGGIRAGASALPLAPTLTFSAPPGGGASATLTQTTEYSGIRAGASGSPLATAQSFTGIRAGASGTLTSTIDIVTGEPIVSGTFGPEVTPLTIPSGDTLSITAGTTTSDAPINVAGALNINGELALFAEDSSIVFTSDKGGSAQANFDPALSAGVVTQTALAGTAPFTPTLAATGDNEPLGTQETSGIFLAQPDYDGNIAPPGLQAYTFTPGMRAVDATSDVAPVQWRALLDGTDVVDEVYDVYVRDTANPFGNYAKLYMDDDAGTLFEQFRRGQLVTIEYSTNDGVTFDERFIGYVVEARENERNGADVLAVTLYTFDQFLRRSKVSTDLSGKRISEALALIIQNDTPVQFDSAQVDVGDDVELRQSFKGEPVEETLQQLRFKSVNEEFGVDREGTFFFRPPETRIIERGITDVDWFDYDIPREGKESVNEVAVYYNDDNDVVVVDDGADKQQLQESLSLVSPGTQSVELSRPNIDNILDAEDVGRQFLQLRNETLTGTVTTFGLFDAEPGDTIAIDIGPRGIDDEFVIAQIEYEWVRDETVVTIVEKDVEVDNLLVRLSEAVARVDTQDTNRDAVPDRVFESTTEVVIEPTVTVGGTTTSFARVTNLLLNEVAGTWSGSTPPQVATIKVGDDGSALSRTNTDLGNAIASGSVSETFPDSTSVSYTATVTASDVEEVGLFDSADRLLARATFDPIASVSSVTVTLTVRNAEDAKRSVITEQGAEAVRDIIADNEPALPTRYAFGDGSDLPVASNTALNNEVAETEDIGTVTTLVGDDEYDAATITEPAIVDFNVGTSTVGRQVAANGLFVEAEDVELPGVHSGAGDIVNGQVQEDPASLPSAPGVNPDEARASQEIEVFFSPSLDVDGYLEFTWQPEYDMDASDVVIAARVRYGEAFLGNPYDGQLIFEAKGIGFPLGFVDIKNRNKTGAYEWEISAPLSNYFGNTTIPAGSLITIRIRQAMFNSNSGSIGVDCVWVGDNTTYPVNFDNVTEKVSNFTYSNPGTIPDGESVDELLQQPSQVPYGPLEIALETITAGFASDRWFVSLDMEDEVVLRPTPQGEFRQTQFFIKVTGGNGETIQLDNATSGAIQFNTPTSEVDIVIGVGSYSDNDDQGGSPLFGQEGMVFRGMNVQADFSPINVEDIGTTSTRVADPAGFNINATLTEGGHKADDTDNSLLTHTTAYPDVAVDGTFRLSTDDVLVFRNPGRAT